MILERFPDVQRLSADDKLLFVSELWNDLAEHPAEIPVSQEILQELDARIARFHVNPQEFTTWESAQQRILGGER